MSARGGKKKQKVLSRSARAGVLFPVARMLRYLRNDTHHLRIGAGSPVYMAAVIEYLVAEILELAGNAAKEFKRGRITPRHILLAIANDDELHQLLKHVTIAQGGVVPKIHAALIGPSRGKHSAVSTSPSASGVSSPSKVKAATKAIAKKIKASTSPVVNNVSVFKGKPKKADSIPDGSGGFLTLSEKKLFLGQKLTVMQGDIVKMVADAIVHPTNSTYHLGGEVGQAILKAGGKEFQQEIDTLLKNQGSIATAEAAICTGHKFSAKFVIHVNSPTWGENNSQQNLDKAVKNVLKLADDKQLKSLAIPSISSGKTFSKLATICPAHNVPAKFVINCNGPTWKTDNAQALLDKSIKSCLQIADEKGLKSVAIPSLGSGRAGFPKQTAAQIILASIRDYFSNAKTTSLKQIYFVLFDAESVNVYTTELARLDG